MSKINLKEVMASFSVGFVVIMCSICFAFFTNIYMWQVLGDSALKYVVDFVLWIAIYINIIGIALRFMLVRFSK